MFEALSTLNDYLPYVKIGGVLIGILLVVVTIAVLTYVVKTAFRPFMGILGWIIGHTPGEQPGEILQGISYGARMLLWAGIIGLTVWGVFH